MSAITLSRGNLYIGQQSKIDVFGIAMSMLFAFASIFGVNMYEYGTKDQVITIPFLKEAINPALYPNDFLVAQKPYFYTFLWEVSARIIRYLHVDMTLLFFTLYVIAMVATFYALYLIAFTLFNRKDTAVLALFFILFTRTSLALSYTLDELFLTRSAVLPFLLFALYFFLKERFVLSYALLGVGFLIHPLTTIYAAALIGVASLINMQRIGIRRLLISIGVFVVLASPILVWKALYHPASLSTFYADPRWLALMRLRSTHHLFPFSWELNIFLEVFALLAAFVVSWKYQPKPFYHRVVVSFVGTIIAMWIVDIIFSEWLPLSIMLQIQLFRSTVFLIYFALIYIAHFVVMEIRARQFGIGTVLAAVLVVVALYDTQHWKIACAALLAVLTLIVLYQLVAQRTLSSQQFVLLIAGLCVAVGAVLFIRQPHFSINNAQNEQWLDVQQWANRSTDIADTFIVPPANLGFRVESERTIYGDWKDGTQMFFNPEFGYEWIKRMQKLGFTNEASLAQDFKQVDQTTFVDIANDLRIENHAVFLVMYRDRAGITFPVAYHNKDFTVYKVTQ